MHYTLTLPDSFEELEDLILKQKPEVLFVHEDSLAVFRLAYKNPYSDETFAIILRAYSHGLVYWLLTDISRETIILRESSDRFGGHVFKEWIKRCTTP
jgi:hypothetical protein